MQGNRGPFKRPWQTPVAPLTKSENLDVYYPCDDEDNGMVYIGWRGPSVADKIYDCLGCSLLAKFFADTSVSPLQKEFVERDSPYASDVDYVQYNYLASTLCFKFENVPKDKIPLIKEPLMQVFNDICSNGIDMKRMKTVVHKSILETLSALENEPHSSIAHMLFNHILYGNTKQDVSYTSSANS